MYWSVLCSLSHTKSEIAPVEYRPTAPDLRPASSLDDPQEDDLHPDMPFSKGGIIALSSSPPGYHRQRQVDETILLDETAMIDYGVALRGHQRSFREGGTERWLTKEKVAHNILSCNQLTHSEIPIRM